MVIGTLYGLTGAIEFVAPDLLGNIGWLVFGRIRTVHTNLVIFGFVVPALLSVGHFIVPHLPINGHEPGQRICRSHLAD
jgi:cbb3-type cytochrome oxidase subunit 1